MNVQDTFTIFDMNMWTLGGILSRSGLRKGILRAVKNYLALSAAERKVLFSTISATDGEQWQAVCSTVASNFGVNLPGKTLKALCRRRAIVDVCVPDDIRKDICRDIRLAKAGELKRDCMANAYGAKFGFDVSNIREESEKYSVYRVYRADGGDVRASVEIRPEHGKDLLRVMLDESHALEMHPGKIR